MHNERRKIFLAFLHFVLKMITFFKFQHVPRRFSPPSPSYPPITMHFFILGDLFRLASVAPTKAVKKTTIICCEETADTGRFQQTCPIHTANTNETVDTTAKSFIFEQIFEQRRTSCPRWRIWSKLVCHISYRVIRVQIIFLHLFA